MNQTPVRVSKMAPSQTPVTGTPKSSIPKPKQPKLLMPYMKYTKRNWDEVKRKHPDLKIGEISKIIGQMWREIDETEKNRYSMEYEREKIEYEREKLEYEKAMQAYERSLPKSENTETPARSTTSDDKTETASKPSGKKVMKTVDPSLPANISTKFQDRLVLSQMDSNRKIQEQKVDYHQEEVIEAHQRFNNNNQYMGILFNQYQVEIPETDENRLKFYSKFQESLINFKCELESEIDELKNKFNSAKRKHEERYEKFLEDIKTKTVKIDTKDTFEKMLDKAMNEIKQQFEKEPSSKTNIDSNKVTALVPGNKSLFSISGTLKETAVSKAYNQDNLTIHDEDSASTEIDDEEIDSN